MRSICPKREEFAYMINIRQWLFAATFAIAIVCLASLTGSNSTSANAQNPVTNSNCNSTSPNTAPAEEESIGGASPVSFYWFFVGHPIFGYNSYGLAQQFSNMLSGKVVSGNQTDTSTNVALNSSNNIQAGGPCKAAVPPKK